jgi:hypothetical protein
MALGEDRILPFYNLLAYRSKNGEPVYSLLLTGIIVEVSILLGDLNTIAPLLTMFFLITYGMINMTVFIEQSVGITSFRPSFKVPSIIPLIGGIWCFIVMFLINPVFAAIALVIILIVYIIQIKRELSAPWGDVRAAIFITITEWATKTAALMPQSAKIWKPNLLIPVENPKNWLSIIGFIRDLSFPKGSVRLFSVKVNSDSADESNNSAVSKEELNTQLNALIEGIRKEGIFTSTLVIEAENFLKVFHVITQVTKGMYFSPNIIFLTMSSDPAKTSQLDEMIHISEKTGLGILILGLHPKTGFGRRAKVNLWLRDKSPNQNLAILIALEIQREWGEVALIRVTDSEEKVEEETLNLKQIIEEGRMPTRTELVVLVGSFNEAIKCAPLADINIFGMSDQMSSDSLYKLTTLMDTTCLFAMGSGSESILS